MKQAFLFFVFLGIMNNVCAQYFQTGQDPAYLKWRQINTTNFQIIYPDYYEFQAKQLAAKMEKVYEAGSIAMQHHPKNISIILHTQTVHSNGLVAWAPKRVEFYTIPHQGIYAQNWTEQLAIHEFRHVLQIDKINSELPAIIKAVTGQQGAALIFGAYLPWWFTEGDAVVTETAFSTSGRGRFPTFLMEHRALAVEKGNYAYDKAYNGSFKNFVPDHYRLGYYLVGASRLRYGKDLWNSVLTRVGQKPLSLNPVNKVLKQKTGMNKVQLYNSVFDSLRTVWIEEDKNFKPLKYKVLTTKQKTYTSYGDNHWLNDTTIISYKTALNEIPTFVKIYSNGREEKIIHPGRIFRESVNYRDEWIVWSERIPDPRWQHSGKSVVWLLNVQTKEKLKINTEFTAFAPNISIQKDRVAVVESDFSSNNYLSVYSIADNKLLHRIQTQNNYLFSPEWINENELMAVALLENTKRLVKINLEKKEMNILVDKDLGELKDLRLANGSLYFIASFSGKNELYRYDLKEKNIRKTTSVRFGIESPAFSPNGKKMVLSDYTANGFRLIGLERHNLKETDIESLKKANYALADALHDQEAGIIHFSDTDTATNIVSKRYSKATHLINFHSWAPVSVDPANYGIKPGVSYLSQNKLGTAVLNVGYEWRTEEKTGNFYGKYTFRGWYPVFDIEWNGGKRASQFASVEKRPGTDGITKNDTTFQRFTWRERNLGFDVRIPFDFSRGRFSRLLQPEIQYDFTVYKHNNSTPSQFINGNHQSITYRLYYQQLRRKSRQDVFPDFGVVVDGIYRHSPFGKFDLGNLTLAQSYLFLPGILKNHGMRFYSGIQKKNAAEDFNFSDIIRYPRGWGKINTNRMVSLAFDYKMPLLYPDKSIGGLAYFKRITTALFADFANLNGNLISNGEKTGTYNARISSFGAELTCDINVLRFYAPVEIGFRTSYLPKTENVYFDLLFSIDFNSL